MFHRYRLAVADRWFWRCDHNADRPHSAAAISPHPNFPYSGPRPTNPKPHSDWIIKRVPLNDPSTHKRSLSGTHSVDDYTH